MNILSQKSEELNCFKMPLNDLFMKLQKNWNIDLRLNLRMNQVSMLEELDEISSIKFQSKSSTKTWVSFKSLIMEALTCLILALLCKLTMSSISNLLAELLLKLSLKSVCLNVISLVLFIKWLLDRLLTSKVFKILITTFILAWTGVFCLKVM